MRQIKINIRVYIKGLSQLKPLITAAETNLPDMNETRPRMRRVQDLLDLIIED